MFALPRRWLRDLDKVCVGRDKRVQMATRAPDIMAVGLLARTAANIRTSMEKAVGLSRDAWSVELSHLYQRMEIADIDTVTHSKHGSSLWIGEIRSQRVGVQRGVVLTPHQQSGYLHVLEGLMFVAAMMEGQKQRVRVGLLDRQCNGRFSVVKRINISKYM